MMNKIKFLKLQMLIFSSILVTLSQAVADDIKILDLETPEIKSDNNPPPVKKVVLDQIKPDLKVLYKTQNLTPEAALVVAQAAIKNCRESGYQVSVAVLDKGGIVQVLLRDRLAGNKTPDIAVLKAQTALSFKASTSSLANSVLENKSLEAVKDVPGVLFLAGGVTISTAGSIIGAVGVSGAPDAKFDERCAILGLKPIEGLLEFAE